MRITAAAVAGIALSLPAAADDWSWRMAVNAWLPSVHTTTNLEPPGGGNISARTEPGNYLDNLEFTFMGTLEARRGRWSFLADAVYLSFGDYDTKVRSFDGPFAIPVDSATESDLKGFVTTIAAGYEVSSTPGARMDVIAGARYTRLKVRLDWNVVGPAGGVSTSGSAESTKDFFDGVVGIRGKVDLGGNWDLRYYADVGAGSSRLTWQAAGAVGYRFGWGDVVLGYRHLAYEMHNDRPIADMTFSGPQIAVGFSF
jgi:hypothetical protein